MTYNNETNTLVDLTTIELINIDGGAPTVDTGFFYDASYYAVTGARLYLYYKWGINTY